jgi:hypothetical protein
MAAYLLAEIFFLAGNYPETYLPLRRKTEDLLAPPKEPVGVG